MMRVLAALVLVGLGAACGPCNVWFMPYHMSERSGSETDDYVEAPLPEWVEASFGTGVRLSNEGIEMLRDDRANELYERMEKGRVQRTEFDERVRSLRRFGSIREYLPGQWSVWTDTVRGEEVYYVTKLVDHEGGRVMYVFTFADEQDTLVDFSWQPYRGVHTPGDGAGRTAGIDE